MRIFLIEDNNELADMIIGRFRRDGHVIDREADGEAADQILRCQQFDLVLLDINLPGMDGFKILKSLRARRDKTPVMLLTARSEIDDRVIGLDAGADDYMTKPFDFRELAARCRVLARRRAGEASNVYEVGNFVFDRAAKRATTNGVDLDLRQREIQLLETMLDNLGRVISKEDVMDKLYAFDDMPSLNAIEQTVTRLRKKLEGSPLTIRTIRGLGYIANVCDA